MFVGSSSETKGLIRGLKLNLTDEVAVENWATTAWPLSRSTLDGIERKLDDADFAAFILAPEDIAIIRGERVLVPRDNVLLELGISFGRIGRDRTFILAPKGPESNHHRPSDLWGITVIEYEREKNNRATMSDPADELLEAIQERGLKDRPGADGALTRGDTTRIEVVADGALHVFESRNTYADELQHAVKEGEKVPAKFQFAQADGGRHWLRLCRSNNYQYFDRAKAHLRDNAPRLADKVCDAAGTAAIDLVSLGCGDGSKDDIILRALAAGLTESEYIYYYPVDISDILLVEAVRHVSQRGLDRARFRCKPVLGDFTKLPSLTGIIAHRDNTNLFSVLGNAIGSFDEPDIFTSIAGAMRSGDLVLLEANIGEPDDSVALLEDYAANQWDLSTLDALGIPRASCDLQQEMRSGVSIVPGTRTLVSYAVPRGNAATKYMLSAMHHYNFEELKQRIEHELGVVLIDNIPGDGVCLLLGQRQS
jgi:hypothetical protein